MKTTELIKNIEADKDIQRNIKSISHFTNQDFHRHASRYLNAIIQGRMCCVINSVSKSGMSRTLKFMECDGSKKDGFRYYNFYAFFVAMGFTKVKDSDYFRVRGCGMDMVFDTNYRIIHKLHKLGFITEGECRELAQITPHVL